MGSKAPGCARSSPGQELQRRRTGSSQKSQSARTAATPLGNGNRLPETFHKYLAAGGTLLTGSRSSPSSAQLRIPHAVIPAGSRGTNQVPSSNPLGKWDFKLTLPKLDKCFTSLLRRMYKSPKPGTQIQNTEEGDLAAGLPMGALPHAEMTRESSQCCPLPVPIKGGTEAGRALPGTVWWG